MKLTILSLAFSWVFFPIAAHAEIVWNGFASFHARTPFSKETYDRAFDEGRIDYSDSTKLGLNMRAPIQSNLAAVAQVVVAQRTIINDVAPDWAPRFDWFFLSYDATDKLNFKFGRQLMPSSLHGEFIDVGLTYPWRAIPTFVAVLDRFKSFEGASAAYQLAVGETQVTGKVLVGGAREESPKWGGFGIEARDIFGSAITVEHNRFRALIGYNQFRTNSVMPNYAYDPQTPSTGAPYSETPFGDLLQRYVVGLSYDGEDIVTRAEFSENRDAGLGGKMNQGSYIMAGYHLGKFLPHYTWAQSDWNLPASVAPGYTGNEISHQLGLNYQWNSSAILKVEFIHQKSEEATIFVTKENQWADSASIGVDIVF